MRSMRAHSSSRSHLPAWICSLRFYFRRSARIHHWHSGFLCWMVSHDVQQSRMDVMLDANCHRDY